MKMYRKCAMIFMMHICFWASLEAQNAITVCESCEITSIQEAISVSAAFDTISVKTGVYHEYEIRIDKPLVLYGEGEPLVHGDQKGSVFQVGSDHVSISGFRIKGVGFSHTEEYAAIHVSDVDSFQIQNNIIEEAFFGILIEGAKKGVISGNIIKGTSTREFYSGNGIHAWKSSDLMIRDNEVFGMRDGIYFEFVNKSFIINNISKENIRYGLHFMFSNYDDYEGNTFVNNGAGVAVMFSKFILMKRNTFDSNWGTSSFGLLLKEIYDAEIAQNLFKGNTTGIQVDGSTRIKYTENDFLSNGWAIKIAGGCYSNIFRANNFSGNSFDLSYNSKMNDNLFEGNYWESYAGYDLDKDGVGDVPYRPIKLFSYVVNKTPETIILLRSLFIDILNFSERVSPVFTPDNLVDASPSMKWVAHD